MYRQNKNLPRGKNCAGGAGKNSPDARPWARMSETKQNKFL